MTRLMGRVRIGTAANPADAALIRSVFEAHEIHVAIGAEEHASMLGGLGGAFVPLHVTVDEADAEEAVALLHDIREGDHATVEGDTGDDPDDDVDGTEDQWKREPPEALAVTDGEESIEVRIARRRRTMVALLLAFCISFGTAHMFTRAWLRGMILAGVEALGFAYLAVNPALGGCMVGGAIFADAVGSIWRISQGTALPRLPAARVVR